MLTEYLKSLTNSRGTSQRSLHSSSKKLQNEKRIRQPVENQLYPLTDYETTDVDVDSHASRSDSDVEKGRCEEAIPGFIA